MSNDNTEIPTTPEDGTAALQPVLVGKLEESEFHLVNSLRQSAAKIINDVGQVEAQQFRLLSSLDIVERRAQEVLARAAERWGVPQSPRWSIGPDGSVYAAD